MKLQPLNKRIIVRQVEEEQVSKGGIVMTTDRARGKQQVGEVLAVDKDSFEPEAPCPVSVGDKVLFAKYSGTEYKDEDSGDDLLIVELTDLLAIVKS